MTTYYARKEYTYTTGDAIFGIPFDYIRKEHISVSINDETTENYTYLNDTQIQVLDTLEAGDVVTIARNTPISSKMVVFSDTSILNKDTQNLAQDQVFDAVQEIYDNNAVFQADIDNQFTEYKTTVNNEIDIIDGKADTAVSTANSAVSTAESAESKADSAVSTANSAESKADAAVNTANSANSTADSAASTANSASSTATSAYNKAESAISTANTASSTADTALEKATTALSNSNTAVSTANTANSTASAAETKANNAVSTANTASSNASTALETANSASSTASTASSNASTALETATAASGKVDAFEVDIAAVIEAAEKINELEQAVSTATTAATTASNKADVATNKATEAINAADRAEAAIPSQTGQNGKFLKTNGTATSWEDIDLSNYVTLSTDQNITGTKTFVGAKKVGFKQSGASDKLGFTLYNNSGTEKGYLEYNPSNTVDNVPLMTLGNYASAAAGLTHVGFRKYSSITGAAGAYNLLTPLVSDAKTPFNLTTTYSNFYLPLGFTDGTSTVLTAKTGMVDLSSILPYEVFIAEYGVTSFADIQTAYNTGKAVFVKDNGLLVPLINYDVSRSRADFRGIDSGSGTYNFRCVEKTARLEGGSTAWYNSTYQLELTRNLVTSISNSSTDTQYPSAKCVYDNCLHSVSYDSTTQTLTIG